MNTLKRQIIHWLHAAEKLSLVNDMASETAWKGLHTATEKVIKNYLQKSVDGLVIKGRHLQKQIEEADSGILQTQLRKAVLRYKADYLCVETTVHFFTDAINTRTVKETAALLKGCDVLCNECLELFLQPLGKQIPFVITYLDKGLGAAIMKAGLRLWDGSISPAALIKVTFHNLKRPTSVLHECGHQIAHILNWNRELAKNLYDALEAKDKTVAKAFSGWSSEIAADAIAFCTTGFAATAALHDVLDAEGETVFHYDEGDPHPISFLRVLLNCAFCNVVFGKGPWNEMQEQWIKNHPVTTANKAASALIKKSVPLLKEIAAVILARPQKAFNNKSMLQFIDTAAITPQSLGKINTVLQTHTGMINNYSSMQMAALTGYRIGTGLYDVKKDMEGMRQYLIKIGNKNIHHYSLN